METHQNQHNLYDAFVSKANSKHHIVPVTYTFPVAMFALICLIHKYMPTVSIMLHAQYVCYNGQCIRILHFLQNIES